MNTYSLTHLSDGTLLRALANLVACDRATTADLLAHIAEVDARKLYLPAAYPSMYAYCVEHLGLSEDAAYKRITAGRCARRFPEIFGLVAEGRLNLSAVVMLAPRLTPGNAAVLLAEAAGKRRAEIEALLARRFPTTEAMPLVESVPDTDGRLVPGQVGTEGTLPEAVRHELAPGRVAPTEPGSRMTPIATERFTLRITIDQATHDLLRHAQDLLGHQVAMDDLAAVLARVVQLGVRQLERTRCGAVEKPRRSRGSGDPRHVAAEVKRAVWKRDDRQCTFVSESGHRCAERRRLELDHVVPVARGGRATVENLRLRCRAHNQYDADRAFGAEFMDRKRREAAERQRARERAEEVIPWLRQLGLKTDEARRAAELCESIPDASLEVRVKRALTGWLPRGTVRIPAPCG